MADPELTVTVTTTHIENGKPGEPEACAIALAVLDSVRHSCEVEVTGASILLISRHTQDIIASYFPPQEVKDFINDFDGEQGVKPFTFTLV